MQQKIRTHPAAAKNIIRGWRENPKSPEVIMLRRERKNTESKNARRMSGTALTNVKRVLRAARNEIAADTLAMAAGMGSAAVMNSSICGIVNGAAKGYYDKAGVELVVRKHRWSKPERINSKALRTKVYSAEAQGWWFNPSVIAGTVAGTATRGIVKDALNYHAESQDSSESWDSYYEEETAEE